MRATAVIVTLCLVFICASPAVDIGIFNELAEKCTDEVCKAEENCRCSSATNPLSAGTSPQLISLTFVEAVTENLYSQYLDPLLMHRVNPDGTPIGATFFVPHEYTDYGIVNALYIFGFEIGVYSITKNSSQEYWRTASQELLLQEFGGQKEILTTFGGIPNEDIIGVRTPTLQLAGNYSIEAFVSANLTYDSSWPTKAASPLFPYTLNYLSTQECLLGAECPNESFKGFWIAPIQDLIGNDSMDCNTLAACNVNGTVDEIATWLSSEISKIRNDSRVPLTLIIESHWFEKVPNSFEALSQVLDDLANEKDVFLVSLQQVIEWTKNPVPYEEYQTQFPNRTNLCTAVICKLATTDGAERYMKSCEFCPAVYPWLGNPKGLAQN